MSKKSPDRRPACGDTSVDSAKVSFGGCFNQKDSTIDNIRIKQNVTEMRSYSSIGETVEPYSFAEETMAPYCGNFYQYPCGDRDNPTGQIYCGKPLITDIAASGSNKTFPVGQYYNTYIDTALTKSFSSCRSVGFKSAYAHKNWHGRHGYNSRNWGQSDNWDWCYSCNSHNADNSPDGIKYLALSATANYSRRSLIYNDYGTLNGTCNCGTDVYDNYCPNYTLTTDTTITAEATNNVSVDRHSGNQTVSSCTKTSSDGLTDTANYAWDLISKANGNITDIEKAWVDELTANTTCDGCTGPDVITGGGSKWHLEWHKVRTCYDVCMNPTLQEGALVTVMDIDTASGTLDIIHYLPNGGDCQNACVCDFCCETWTSYIHWHYSFGGSTMTYSMDADTWPSHSVHSIDNDSVTGTLSGTYTADDLYNDVVGLLAYLPLDRDDLFPWRTDSLQTMGPVAYYDESGPVIPSVDNCNSTSDYTGKIHGIPAPAGMDRVYNPEHKNFCSCIDDNECQSVYVNSYGAWNEDIGGGSATAWTNAREGTSMPPEAFVGNGFEWTTPNTCNSSGPGKIIDGGLWAGKYAEIIIPKQSINFARPCGLDRFQLLSNSERYIVPSETIGNTLTLDSHGSPTDIATNNLVWVCGIDGLEGCWRATKVNDYKITLIEPRIVSASALPYPPVKDCGTGLIAKLKYQNLQPAICGRIDITNATKTSPVTCSLMESSYLVTGDKVYIENAIGGNINGTWTIKALDSNNIALINSNGITADDYKANTGQVRSIFATDWRWNDSNGKNEFVSYQWLYNYRDIGEYNRILNYVPWIEGQPSCNDQSIACTSPAIPPEPRHQQLVCGIDQNLTNMTCLTSCIAHNPCSPLVAFFSPNNETFKNTGSFVTAINLGFGKVTYDDQYGSMWQGAIKQAIDDPFFQKPPCPPERVYDESDGLDHYECNGTFTQDDGNCIPDEIGDADLGIPSVKHYAMPNQVENRCSVPVGSPTLPNSNTLGCLKPSDVVNGCKSGNVCSPPYGDSGNLFLAGASCNIYKTYPYATPWITYLNQLGCVCGNGQFATEYSSYGIGCDTELIVPAP
jgi:hypothetical protein